MGGFLDDAAVTEDTFRLLFQMLWVFQIGPLNLFGLFQPKQKEN